jgi:hypothetical protein
MAKLKALVIDRPMKPGRYADGDGLYLLVGPNGAKSWIFRYRASGRERFMGLGSYEALSLSDARTAASECRRQRAADKDPMAERDAERERQRQEQLRAKPFKECAEKYIAENEGAWKNDKHRQQWRNTLETYVYKLIGKTAVGNVDKGAVLEVLRQTVPKQKGKPAGMFWVVRPETASRVPPASN